MATAPDSPRISLEQSRRQAKDLLKAFRAGDPAVADRIRWNHPRFRRLSDAAILAGRFVLADAQLVIARLHHFASWPKLLHHIETLERQEPAVMRYEAAADAIIAGDAATLGSLLHRHPDLVHARSTRSHNSPLLHYVSANGVEDYRQKSPANATVIARMLLDAGADVNATSEAYGGGSTALGLVATSTPPHIAGVQIPLIDVLLEYGATIVQDGRTDIVRDALANGCPEAAAALVERGATVTDIVTAAGVGRLDLVERLAPRATARQLGLALVMAARSGDRAMVEYLLEQGADVAASDGMTALHEAAGGGWLDLVRLLIDRGAPLEKLNAYGGTVLDGTLWYAYHADVRELARLDYPRIIDALVEAGARTDVYPEMAAHIAEIRERTRQAMS